MTPTAVNFDNILLSCRNTFTHVRLPERMVQQASIPGGRSNRGRQQAAKPADSPP